MTWQDEQKKVATGVTRGRFEDDDDIQDYKKPWVGLTDEERNQLWRDVIKWGDPSHDDVDLMKALEAKLKEKNT